jgi:hypothetical protein
MSIEYFKALLFQARYNDLFDALERALPASDAIRMEYHTLKNEWLHRSSNFNPHDWSQRMLAFIKYAMEATQADVAENSTKQNIQSIQHALTEGDLEKFAVLLNSSKSDENSNLIITYLASYNAFKRDVHSGILTREEQRIEQRRLEQAALYLIEQLKK